MLKYFLHLPWRLRHPPSPKPPQADTSNATGVPPSSLPPSQLSDPVAAAQNISGANQLTHDSQPVTSLVQSTQALSPHGSVVPPPTHLVSPSKASDLDTSQNQGLLATSRPSTDGKPGNLYVQNTHESRNVVVEGNMNQVYYYANTIVNDSNTFMEKLLERTILGAAFDSSARDPPPRCHPGTRLSILARCLEFIVNASGERKMRWVFGAAGVGKSAIMQNVAESPLPSVSKRVSIFFSINGRNDGTKTIMTLAYQLAAKCELYRQFIEYEVTRDPSLLQSSVPVQFQKFVIEPFIHHPQLNSAGRVLIIIDGLDECDNSRTQKELLQLISDFCSTCPSSPIVWIIASRPEAHITAFFAQDHVKAVYEKEEILIDSDGARDDVEKFLRSELTNIQREFSLNPQWPPEQDLWKLASAAGGLFVYADTVIKHIGDSDFGNPTSQLNDVLKVIDAYPLPDVRQEEHPMARLDALYAQILSSVPKRGMANTRKILLALVLESKKEEHLQTGNFLVFCNWLGMTCDDAYAAIRPLNSLLNSPSREEAHMKVLRPFHKSFMDYISDRARSELFTDIELEAYNLTVQCSFRILEQAPDGIDFRNNIYSSIRGSGSVPAGPLAHGPGTGSNISLTWPVGEGVFWDNDERGRRCFNWLSQILWRGLEKENQSLVPISALVLQQEKSQRDELMKHGLLKLVPTSALDSTYIVIWTIKLQFARPTATTGNVSKPWYQFCTHKRTGNWGRGQDENWTTEFGLINIGISYEEPASYACPSCLKRLKQQLVDCKTRSPDHLVTILFTSTGTCFVEFQFIDLDDGVSEWTYWFLYELSEEERRILGSTV
ncbi:hypothetical protein AGABI1DRAFT_109631 [Agaricus bisporus var. burnettii JB137-S8]|uniref:Nephrocystin 3-like N-terminal domain-containing protein n=1 Tax=Agaricus bisporus var. burnettii (strain JB137-S8 / ATCC MYA-4627 / FGSC 10392) TaxID=597362 RepID=K5WIL6_AGABU|nr:uncharacterized protein AGABI1DRAFT_109631 [Agaricus bisporus var. burnettii JB137-S8]EKM75091.1 hypothetical protein AGABI1DRAFT_109631 [Agaricus bisporus var. burnettii JB137-S8]